MKRGRRVYPCWPIPAREQRRLALLARLALADMQSDQPNHALVDLLAVALLALLCRPLLAGDRFTQEARQAVEDAAQTRSETSRQASLPLTPLGQPAAFWSKCSRLRCA